MATREHGARGEMYLAYYFHETASEHEDTTKESKLLASEDGVAVELVETHDFNNIYKSHKSIAKKTVYRVAVSDLIDFIKVKGTRVD